MEPATIILHHPIQKKLFWVLVLVLVILLSVSGYIIIRHQSYSSNILDLTTSVNSFSGKIEGINGDTYTISGVAASGKTLRYEVKIPVNVSVDTTNTVPGQSAPTLSASDLQKGMSVIVRTKQDLRLLSGNQFEASSIVVSISNQIQGVVDSVSANTLIVKTPIPPVPLPGESGQPKSYSVLITPNTQISKTIFSPPEPTKQEAGNVTDLTPGSKVNIYTNEDLDSSDTISAKVIIVTEATPAPPNIPSEVPASQSSQTTKPSLK